MRRSSIFVIILLSFIISQAQVAKPDLIPTHQGPLKIQPILHGTLVLEWNGEVIYNDPYGGAEAFKGQKEPSIILITDIHGDHLNPNTLSAIRTDHATFVVPPAVADQLDEKYKTDLVIIENGASTEVNGISISAIPMYNLPESPDSRHIRGRGNGYILNLGGKTVYISGDTEDIKEMRSLKNIDVAFVCMNLPYTMSIDQAASAVLDFKPGIVYPFHYRGKGGLSDVAAFKNIVNDSNRDIDVRLSNWYPGN